MLLRICLFLKPAIRRHCGCSFRPLRLSLLHIFRHPIAQRNRGQRLVKSELTASIGSIKGIAQPATGYGPRRESANGEGITLQSRYEKVADSRRAGPLLRE
jgi:hypothetical protein